MALCSKILHIFLLRVVKMTIFEPKVVHAQYSYISCLKPINFDALPGCGVEFGSTVLA